MGPDTKGTMRHNVVNIYFVTDNSPLTSYMLEESEVYAIMACPVKDLIRVHEQHESFELTALTCHGLELAVTVTKDSFPYNWDNYHYKVALLASRYIAGDAHLVY